MFIILKKTHIFCLGIIGMLFLAGCWDRTEVNDIAIVLGVGLDRADEDQLELSVQIINPGALGGGQAGGGGEGGEVSTVQRITGRTIFDASSKLQQEVSRELFIGHNQVVFIGEKLAEEGIHKYIDYFARSPFPRLRMNVFVTKGGPADFLNIKPDLETSSAEFARKLANFEIGVNITLKDLMEMLSSNDSGAVLPIVKIVSDSPEKPGLRTEGTAVFDKGKMVGEIDEKLTRGLLWLRDEIKTSTVTIEPEEAEGLISFYIFDASTVLKPEIKNGKWKMVVEVESFDDVRENETKLNMGDPATLKKVEKQLEQEIDERIRLTLELVQKEMQVDIVNFGKAFRRHYPKEWNKVKDQWKEKFPEVEVEIKSRVEIQRPGSSTSPQSVPEEEEAGQ
ncbi:Ger(x)C family spore germination protein [Virgibacillus sp. C22-A2]|uniref:Ger(X)C family spore germination protein n=1 Tax=Virgibacillus tibetensis TaxID=3042313 RepID=A0ABU6KFC4_9BACI|nr:Ger(x)C family spore germination protein [Virgibacillus sp. C22-A2]